jgi:pyruvate,water dikinase
MSEFIKEFKDIKISDVSLVGGKNASLGEMFSLLTNKGINIPDGFATTSSAFLYFIEKNNLLDFIKSEIKKFQNKTQDLKKTGKNIRKAILNGSIPKDLQDEIYQRYLNLSKKYNEFQTDIAVRSSATAEDLPDASFAGQLESFLNINNKKDLLLCTKKCFASLFTNRAIIYREEKNFDHLQIKVSVGFQKMIRSDLAGSGVMFTLDTDSGFKNVIEVTASFGLGENVVQGKVIPDEYITFKPLLENKNLKPIIQKKLGKKELTMIYSKIGVKNKKTPLKKQNLFVLTDDEILTLSRWAKIIEDHYQKPMDIEWAKDGKDNKLYIVQARPETVESLKKTKTFTSYSLKEKSNILVEGLSIGEAVACGKAQIIKNVKDIKKFKKDSILVTKETSPDWVPIMKMAKGIITDHGGRTSHAAIVSRELNVPAIVGCINATSKIKDNQDITLCCSNGDVGKVYDKILKYDAEEINIDKLAKIKTNLMINLASPEAAFHSWHLPINGIGLARMEFIINDIIKIHPMALVNFDKLKNKKTKKIINNLTKNYLNKKDYFIDNLAISLSKIAASAYPNPTIVRLSDFKTNEYFNLIGGDEFEFSEENPMIGFRGACRYYNKRYIDGFKLECQALKKAREVIGLNNIIIMIPFCRTIDEAKKVLKVLEENDLKKGENNLKIYMMAEIPSNIILADEFAKIFDGFSIGSNDLTQLTLGVDRDSEILAKEFNEEDESIKKSIKHLIKEAHKENKKVGICGQAPSDKIEFAKFLIENKIDSISLNPDSVVKLIKNISEFEKNL